MPGKRGYVPWPQVDPDYEARRVGALHAFQVLDTGPEEGFDRVTQIASRLFNCPIALVSFVDTYRSWMKSAEGMPQAVENPRSLSFCRFAILPETPDVFLVLNAQKDSRFMFNPLVTGPPDIRFYAGAPLIVGDGLKIGVLCIIDTVPREKFSLDESLLLMDMAAVVVDELVLRAQTHCRQLHNLTSVTHTLQKSVDSLHLCFASIENTELCEKSAKTVKQALAAIDLMQATAAQAVSVGKHELLRKTPIASHPIDQIDMRDVVQRTACMVDVLAASSRVTVSISIAPEVPQVVYSDKAAVWNCLTDLLTNACTYTQEGAIDVSIKLMLHRHRKATIRVEVADTGPGVSAEISDRLFWGTPSFALDSCKVEDEVSAVREGDANEIEVDVEDGVEVEVTSQPKEERGSLTAQEDIATQHDNLSMPEIEAQQQGGQAAMLENVLEEGSTQVITFGGRRVRRRGGHGVGAIDSHSIHNRSDGGGDGLLYCPESDQRGGLYSVRANVTLLKGRCGCNSNPHASSGSVFWFEFPDLEQQADRAVPPPGARTHSHRVGAGSKLEVTGSSGSGGGGGGSGGGGRIQGGKIQVSGKRLMSSKKFVELGSSSDDDGSSSDDDGSSSDDDDDDDDGDDGEGSRDVGGGGGESDADSSGSSRTCCSGSSTNSSDACGSLSRTDSGSFNLGVVGGMQLGGAEDYVMWLDLSGHGLSQSSPHEPGSSSPDGGYGYDGRKNVKHRGRRQRSSNSTGGGGAGKIPESVEDEEEAEDRPRLETFCPISADSLNMEGERVVVCDDSLPTRRLMSRVLERGGFKVDQCSNARDTLALLQKGEHRVAFIDLIMPMMSGVECVDTLRNWEEEQMAKRDPSLPPFQRVCVVGYSANASPADVLEAASSGMDAFMQKPFVPADVFAHLALAFLADPAVLAADDSDEDDADEGVYRLAGGDGGWGGGGGGGGGGDGGDGDGDKDGGVDDENENSDGGGGDGGGIAGEEGRPRASSGSTAHKLWYSSPPQGRRVSGRQSCGTHQ